MEDIEPSHYWTSSGKILNDPIHGHITLPRYVLEFIDTPEFQRLRDLKQLGVTCFIFPGASHHRFEHSIGVSHLANQLISSISKRQPELEVSERDIRCVTLAGLCHDLGHGPFSHAFEEWLHRRGIDFHHEEMSIKMIDLLIDQNSIEIDSGDVKFIQSLIRGEPISQRTEQLENRTWLYDIVANKRNSIDVDKWDYLARDCYHLGMKRSYDFSRLMMNSRVINDEICYHAKEAYNIYEMFHTRYSLFKLVYSHKVGKAIEYMIGDALDLANSYFGISDCVSDAKSYCNLTDCLLRQIETSKIKDENSETSTKLKEAKEIVERLRKRDLYKMADEVIIPSNLPQYQIDVDQIVKMAQHQLLTINSSSSHSTPNPTQQSYTSSSASSIKLNTSTHQQHHQYEYFHPISHDQILIDTFSCNYAMKDKNPVDAVHFFNKWNDESSFSLPKHNVSLLIPDIFSERYMRVYCKHADQVEITQSAFRQCMKQIDNSPMPAPTHSIPPGEVIRRTKTPPFIMTPSNSVFGNGGVKRGRSKSGSEALIADELSPTKKHKASE